MFKYLQDKNSVSLLKVMDSREHPMISLKDFYRRAMIIGDKFYFILNTQNTYAINLISRDKCTARVLLKRYYSYGLERSISSPVSSYSTTVPSSYTSKDITGSPLSSKIPKPYPNDLTSGVRTSP